MASDFKKELVRPEDVKRMLSISDSKLASLIKRGVLKPVMIDGARRYRMDAIQALLDGVAGGHQDLHREG